MFEFIKKIFIRLLTGLANASSHTKCVSLTNQKCTNQPTIINLHPNEYIQEFHYYPFAVNLGRCAGSCDNLNELSNNVCVPNKTENLNLSVFNITTGINESKTLTKNLSGEWKCYFDDRKCNSNQTWNKINVSASAKNITYVKNIIFGTLLHLLSKMVNI